MNIKKVKDKIRDLEEERQKTPEDSFIIDPQLDSLYKIIKEHDKKKGTITKWGLEKRKKELVKQKAASKENKDIDLYLETEREIKTINSKLRELRDTVDFLTTLELKKLMNSFKKSRHHLKFITLVQLAYEGGLRVGEATNLRVNDFDFTKGTMLCRRAKGSTTNNIRLTKNTLKLVEKYLKQYNPREYLFLNTKGKLYNGNSIDQMFKKYCNIAGIPKEKARFHAIKHSRAVHLANSGLGITEIQLLLGHKEINSTMVYFAHTKEQEQNIYEKLEGY